MIKYLFSNFKAGLQYIIKSLFYITGLFVIHMAKGNEIITKMPGVTYEGTQPKLTNEQLKLNNKLYTHIKVLSQEIGERNITKYSNLKLAEDYIKEELTKAGYNVRKQCYIAGGKEVCNLEAMIEPEASNQEIVIIGAHYDSVFGAPGANDNASGVAALLEVAKGFAGYTLKKGIRFVAFVNEEPPFFAGSNMGSMVYAKECASIKEKIQGMISLEMLGCYSTEPGSQDYPGEVADYYPKEGNFIAFVGDHSSKEFLFKAIESFRQGATIPSEGIIAPQSFPGIALSDHYSFWQNGYKGIMLTDTAFFRYKHYHESTDTIDKIDFDNLTRVTIGIKSMLTKLSQ